MSQLEKVVFTPAFGKRTFGEMALGLGRSLKLLGDTTPRAVLTDMDDLPWNDCFDIVIKAKRPRDGFEKLEALDYLDAKQVLALDGDMLAFKRLDAIFAWCRGKNFCVQGKWMEDGSWWGTPFSQIKSSLGVDRLPKFNGGLIYYEPTPEARQILATAKEIYYDFDKTGFGLNRHGQASEELSILVSLMRHAGDWELIPDRMQFQNGLNGPFYDLEMDVTRARCRAVCRQFDTRYAEPYLFHAYFYRHVFIYWRQLRTLETLSAYEKARGTGYQSPLQKLNRSFQRRVLKILLGFKV